MRLSLRCRLSTSYKNVSVQWQQSVSPKLPSHLTKLPGDGSIQVWSGNFDETFAMRPISSFLGLDMIASEVQRPIVTTWWRQKGRMCVGGSSSIVNVWDCPAERRERVRRLYDAQS